MIKFIVMKKTIFLALTLSCQVSIFAAEPLNWDGVQVLPNFYCHKVSHDGTQVVGESESGGTAYYNRSTGDAYFYENCSFGRGYVVSDKGWIVGTELLDMDSQTNIAVIMSEGKVTVPPPFKNYVTSNIHSITPDGSRICGVINTGTGPQNQPFYCDIDAQGNFGEVKILPTPDKDFFGARPQYCTATWLSEDGKTIAGQVIDSRGLFAYPIIYFQNAQGNWEYDYPSKSLFNPEGLEVPSPLGDFDEEYPDAVYPEVEKYITPDKLADWEKALLEWEKNSYADEFDPFDHLEDYMTPESLEEYIEAEVYYNACQDEYNEKNEAYWETMIKLADESVLFVRNAMAISPDGKWMVASGEVPRTDILEGQDMDYYYVPYLFNLETGENKNIGIDNVDLVSNQVTNNGTVLCSTPAANVLPPRSFIYQPSDGEMISIYDYINGINNLDGWWMETYLTGDVPVSDTASQRATITGLVAASEDLTTICGGVLYSALGNDMYFITYMMDDLEAGIEEIVADSVNDGVFTVYNLQGVKVMQTKDASLLHNLPKGIYLINGKKILLGK